MEGHLADYLRAAGPSVDLDCAVFLFEADAFAALGKLHCSNGTTLQVRRVHPLLLSTFETERMVFVSKNSFGSQTVHLHEKTHKLLGERKIERLHVVAEPPALQHNSKVEQAKWMAQLPTEEIEVSLGSALSEEEIQQFIEQIVKEAREKEKKEERLPSALPVKAEKPSPTVLNKVVCSWALEKVSSIASKVAQSFSDQALIDAELAKEARERADQRDQDKKELQRADARKKEEIKAGRLKADIEVAEQLQALITKAS